MVFLLSIRVFSVIRSRQDAKARKVYGNITQSERDIIDGSKQCIGVFLSSVADGAIQNLGQSRVLI